MISLKNRRECFFDDYLIDTTQTTAEFRLHEPIRRECALLHDAPWEGDGCDFHNILKDGDIYRMYYLGWTMLTRPGSAIVVCYAESRDGLHWEKPDLGLFEFEGSMHNNIILNSATHGTNIDNFMVFKDTHPDCLDEQRYKAICQFHPRRGRLPQLVCYFSADGIRFTRGHMITDKGHFDSLNVAFYDELAGKYRCYFRSFHNIPESRVLNDGVRDIRYIESNDFIHWTDPVMIDFGDAEDVPLYTNVVQPYFRAPHMLVGFPSRYIERREWTPTFDELCGREKRLDRMTYQPRYGLTTTDCLFMCSRDGIHFFRQDEAFMRPEAEYPTGWVYGDCYPSYGLIETPSAIEGADTELSFYIFDGHWMGDPTRLYRYSMRMDGFMSLHAGAKEKVIVTKSFTFEGDTLYANIATSARGYAYFTLTDSDGNTLTSYEVFGNSTDKRIPFPADLSAFSQKDVTLTVRLREGDLYAIQFR